MSHLFSLEKVVWVDKTSLQKDEGTARKMFLRDLNADTMMEDTLPARLHAHLSPLYFLKQLNNRSVHY